MRSYPAGLALVRSSGPLIGCRFAGGRSGRGLPWCGAALPGGLFRGPAPVVLGAFLHRSGRGRSAPGAAVQGREKVMPSARSAYARFLDFPVQNYFAFPSGAERSDLYTVPANSRSTYDVRVMVQSQAERSDQSYPLAAQITIARDERSSLICRESNSISGGASF